MWMCIVQGVLEGTHFDQFSVLVDKCNKETLLRKSNTSASVSIN